VKIGVSTEATPTSPPWVVGTDFDAFRTPIGIKQTLKHAGIRIYAAGSTELNAVPSALSCTIRANNFAAGTWIDLMPGKMGVHPSGGWLFSAKDSGQYWFTWPLLAPISNVEYPMLEIEQDTGFDNPLIGVILYSASDTEKVWNVAPVVCKRGNVLQVPLDGSSAWTLLTAGPFVWTDISSVGIICVQAHSGFRHVKSMRFVGSGYTKSVLDTNSQHLYEVKYQSYPVPFRTKSQTDTYAAAQLARLKDPLTSISVRANRLLIPTMYNTVAVSPGSAMTPLVLGADIDPVRGQTRFVFDAYPAGGLVAILDSLNAGIS